MQARKHIPLGGKRYYTNQSKNYGKTRDLVAEEQGKLWEGQRQKSDSSNDGDRDTDKQ